MKPQDVLRAAAKLIEATGLSKGSDARDGAGTAIPLYVTGHHETGKATINPAAVQFSIYGAIVRVLHSEPVTFAQVTLWDALYRRAKQLLDHGSVHPVRAFNEHEETAAREAIQLLNDCALDLEAAAEQAGRPLPPAFELPREPTVPLASDEADSTQNPSEKLLPRVVP